MRKAMAVLICSLFLAVTVFAAQEADKKRDPDTVFQKVANYSQEGYKKDVAPIKKMTIFQMAADWVNGRSPSEEGATLKSK